MKTLELTEKQREQLLNGLDDLFCINGRIDLELELDSADEVNHPSIAFNGWRVDDGFWHEGEWVELEHSAWFNYTMRNYNGETGESEEVVFDKVTQTALERELCNL